MSEEEMIQGARPDDFTGIPAPELWTQDRILALGETAARRISGFSNEVICLVSRSCEIDSAELLLKLNRLMKSFDKRDFKSGLSGRLFSAFFPAKKRPADKLYEKYIAFSKEIDRIFIDIKKYEYIMKDTNEALGKLYEEALRYHPALEEQIQCGKTYISEKLEPWLSMGGRHSADDGNFADRMDSQKYEEAKELLEQRLYDLELSKALSLQTAPVIKLIQKGNSSLIRKMNSAFIVTLPLFKQAVIQVITRKRQKIYMDSMSALNTSSNRLLRRNAKGLSKVLHKLTQADQDGSDRIKAIEDSYHAIIDGIREFERMDRENAKHRDSSIRQLENIRSPGAALMSGQEQMTGFDKAWDSNPGGRK